MSDRLQREIEEILSKVEGIPPQARPRRHLNLRLGQRLHSLLQGLLERLSRVSVGQLMLASIAVILVAYLFRSVIPVANYLIMAGITLFLVSFVLSFRRPRIAYEKRWRGRVVDDREPSLADRLRLWWQRIRHTHQ